MSEQSLPWSEIMNDYIDEKSKPSLEIEGHLNPDEAALLERLASECTLGCIVEIGSLRGKSTVRLARGARLSDCEVYAIDPHDAFMDGDTLVGIADRAVFLRNLVDAGVADIVKPIYLKSHHVAKGWQEPIGLLWIDGDHSYEGVKKDIEDWRGFIPPGGLLAFHDSYFETVSRALSELLEDDRYKVIAKADATTVIQYDPEIPPVYQQPDVSVLIPAYNASKTIEKAVLSALNQEGVSVEVIVFDDASTDDTFKALDNVIADARLVYGKQPKNLGLATTLNDAAEIATGRYFIELDSDDWLEPNCLAPMVEALDANPQVGFVYGQTQYHGLSDLLFRPQPFQNGIFRFGFASLYAFMYRREAWDDGCRYRSTCVIEGKTITIQDWDFVLQLTEHLRWEGIALREQLVLHYNYVHGSLTDFTQAHNAEVVKAFVERWPIVNIQRI